MSMIIMSRFYVSRFTGAFQSYQSNADLRLSTPVENIIALKLECWHAVNIVDIFCTCFHFVIVIC